MRLHQWSVLPTIFKYKVAHASRVIREQNCSIKYRELIESDEMHWFQQRPPPLRWRHNDHDGVSNHQPHGCLLNRLFRRRSKKTSKLRAGHRPLCGEFTGTGEFPAQRASYAENVSIWWRHHVTATCVFPRNRKFIETSCLLCKTGIQVFISVTSFIVTHIHSTLDVCTLRVN